MTSHSRCAKDSALVRHKVLSFSRTSDEHRVLAYVLLKNFVAAAVFSLSYFLKNFVAASQLISSYVFVGF